MYLFRDYTLLGNISHLEIIAELQGLFIFTILHHCFVWESLVSTGKLEPGTEIQELASPLSLSAHFFFLTNLLLYPWHLCKEASDLPPWKASAWTRLLQQLFNPSCYFLIPWPIPYVFPSGNISWDSLRFTFEHLDCFWKHHPFFFLVLNTLLLVQVIL